MTALWLHCKCSRKSALWLGAFPPNPRNDTKKIADLVVGKKMMLVNTIEGDDTMFWLIDPDALRMR